MHCSYRACVTLRVLGLTFKLKVKYFFYCRHNDSSAETTEADPGGRVEGVATPPLGSFQTCLVTHVSPFFIPKIILSYNIRSSPIDHYKKTVAIPTSGLLNQMQDRFSDEDRQACHLLCVVPSIIANNALQLDDEVEGVPFWEKDNPFLKSTWK